MEGETKYTSRLAILLALMVVTLVVVSIDQLRGSGDEQQAAVLRAYAE